MASVGRWHQLVARNAKLLKTAWKKTSNLIQSNLSSPFRSIGAELQPIPIRSSGRQPIHPIAYLKQSRSRWYSTNSAVNAVRRYTSLAGANVRGVKYDKTSFPKSVTSSIVNRLPGRAPFASTLRPNLTGGALGRSAGGYSLGSGRLGGARYFSHGPAAPAEVVQNVSQAVRAFLLSGQKPEFDGNNPRTGEKRYRAVGALQDDTCRKIQSLPKATPGSYVSFRTNPTISALTSMNTVAGHSQVNNQTLTLNTEGLLDVLSCDFSRQLKELAVIHNDIRKLATLGDLLITTDHSSSVLRVHFPGCDAETVEKLCQELGLQRGEVIQDEDFDNFVGTEIALLFPFAPSEEPSEDGNYMFTSKQAKAAEVIPWQDMLSTGSEDFSTRSETGLGPNDDLHYANPWRSNASSPEGYESIRSFGMYSEPKSDSSPLEYHNDFEGIYRFIELCDSSAR